MNRFPVALAGLLFLTAGCSPFAPGNYAVFRIAAFESEQSDDCFPSGQDINDVEDVTTFASGDTFAVFSSGGGRYFLDYGNVLIEGTKSGGTLTFDGEDVDVTYFGGNNASRRVNTNTVTVVLETSGAAVVGRVVSTVDQSCSGTSCEAFDTFSCTTTGRFQGTRVNDVDLEYAL